MRRTLAALALLGLGGVAVAAALTGPEDAPVATSSGGAEVVAAQDDGPRPDVATGKPGGPDAPPFAGDLTVDQLPVLRDAPALTRIDGWLQADGLTALDQLEGEVVVVWFWTFSCHNCTATIPNLQALRDAHGEDVRIVGVHAPEFDFEKEPDAVAAAAADLGVTWPIALDTDKRSFHGWQEGTRAYWPRTYVLDREGRIRFDHVGEGRYDELNATVAALVDAA